jgi:hypothetical protein
VRLSHCHNFHDFRELEPDRPFRTKAIRQLLWISLPHVGRSPAPRTKTVSKSDHATSWKYGLSGRRVSWVQILDLLYATTVNTAGDSTMAKARRVGIYTRVSTSDQTTANQERELRTWAERVAPRTDDMVIG